MSSRVHSPSLNQIKISPSSTRSARSGLQPAFCFTKSSSSFHPMPSPQSFRHTSWLRLALWPVNVSLQLPTADHSRISAPKPPLQRDLHPSRQKSDLPPPHCQCLFPCFCMALRFYLSVGLHSNSCFSSTIKASRMWMLSSALFDTPLPAPRKAAGTKQEFNKCLLP